MTSKNIPTDVQQRLQLFLDEIRNLKKLRLVKSKMKNILNPDEEELMSFLMTFRKFIMTNEVVNIFRALKDCGRYTKDDDIKRHIKELKKSWKKRMKAGSFMFNVDGKNWSPKEILDIYINGKYFHIDEEKAKNIEKIAPSSFPFGRLQFLLMLTPLTLLIITAGKIVEEVLKNN